MRNRSRRPPSPVPSARRSGPPLHLPLPALGTGAASIGKGIGGILFSRFSRSSSQTSGVEGGAPEGEEKRPGESQSSYGLSAMSQSTSAIIDTTLELEHRIDFELREGLVESRYWSAVTSHTAYWSSHDVALFLLTFMYRQNELPESSEDNPDPV